jgi:hypothetical protein
MAIIRYRLNSARKRYPIVRRCHIPGERAQLVDNYKTIALLLTFELQTLLACLIVAFVTFLYVLNIGNIFTLNPDTIQFSILVIIIVYTG